MSEQKSEEMSIDRRKSPKTKRYELGFHLAIDWRYLFIIPLILIVVYFSSANAIAYQNATIARGNNVHNTKYGFDGSVQKSVAKFGGQVKKSWNDTFYKKPNPSNVTDGFINYTRSDENITEIPHTSNDYADILKTTTLPTDIDARGGRTIFYYGQKRKNTAVKAFGAKIKMADDDIYTTETITENYEMQTTTDVVESTTMYTTTIQDDYYTTDYISTTEFPDVTDVFNYTENVIDSDYGDNETITNHLEFDSKKNVNISEINEKINCSACTAAVNDINNNKTESNNNIQYQSTKGENNSSMERKNESESKLAAVKKSEDNSSESTEVTTEEDYNLSYELQEYDEGSKQKTTTEKPQIQNSSPLDAIRDIAGTFIESIYERVVPKGLRDIFSRMQEQNEKLETIKLRSKEENGGLGQFGRSILKGLSGPLNQLMQGVRDYGSLDSDKNFFAGVASGVVTVADTVADSFKDRVKAIYPGTLWCGDGDMARSAEVGLFFMTDSCCRRHDTCKHYITAGSTKYGLTNTGLFTRSHCECDKAFYRCLKKTNSLISTQIGLTYFSILGPQCFKREHPIMRCKRRTRYTGQKCEEYDLDHDHPKIWQWFDNETF